MACSTLMFGCIEVPASGSSDQTTMFEPVSVGRIATDGGASRGVGWADFDRDGDPDLAVANTAGQWNSLYLNTQRGRRDDRRGETTTDSSPPVAGDRLSFIKASDPNPSLYGAVASAGGSAEGVSWVDYDGDGDLDLHMVTRGQEADLLFENEGEAGLALVTEGLVVRPLSHTMACWADVDGDGWLDVYLVAYRGNQRNKLLRNLGDGIFEEVTDSPAVFGTGTGRSCGWGDPDDDGLPDLYVGLASERNRFFWNKGEFELERDSGPSHYVNHVGYSYGVSWADFDGDGFQDLFVANFDVQNVLYRNDGTGRLVPVSQDPTVTDTGGASKGHAWGDYDLDGDLDLFVANGTYAPDMRNFLYLNDGGGGFTRTSDGELTIHADTSAGAAWADIDLDGDLDLFVANWGSSDQVNRFYRNTAAETTGRSWVTFHLRSTSPNSHGWGAKVQAKIRARGASKWMTRWNIPTTGYGSQNSLLVHFGIDDATTVDSLVVRWPSGRTDTHTGIPARAAWMVIEGGALAIDGDSTELRR